MAKHVVDRIVERDGREAPCRTHEIPLGMPVEVDALPRVEGVSEETLAMFSQRYGYAANDVLAVAEERRELRERIVPGLPDLLAEVVIAARLEQARSVGDVLLRRTRLGLLAAPVVCAPDGEVARTVARVLGDELGWDEAQVESEVAAWQAEAAAEGIALSEVAAG
jgi:glycerol-3-phosphate dehydrogenase